MSDAAIFIQLSSYTYSMRENYSGLVCARQLCRLPHNAPGPQRNAGRTRGSVHAGTAYTVTLRSYRRRTRKVPQDSSTTATNVLNCTSSYRHHGMVTTNCTVTQYINDYSLSHTVNNINRSCSHTASHRLLW